MPGLDPKLVDAELGAVEPAFLGPDGHFGELDPHTLRAWAEWEARFGIVQAPRRESRLRPPVPGRHAVADRQLTPPAW